ncbi:MAG: thermonuclease family protein [Nanoarchaeota archaeon]
MKLKRLLIFLLIILVLALLSIFWPQFTGKAIDNNSNNYQKESAFVIRVVDGDTIHVNINGEDETIRLLGVNTPEKKKPYYQEAKDFLINEIENKSIELLRDKENIDKYERKLRYVFYNERLIDVEILEKGLATSFMLLDLKYKDKLINAEKFAQQNEIGLWEKSSDECAGCIKLDELNASEEFFIIKNICDFDCDLDKWEVKDDANHFFFLNDLEAGEEKEYDSKIKIWNDEGDRFFMRDEDGKLVVFWEY